jgi:predicted RNase H-like HicB family nuclease
LSGFRTIKEEAFKHIQEVVQMVVEELVEEGEKIPEVPKEQVQVFLEPRVVVTI